MKIVHTDIWKFSIPMHPFTIATGTSYFAQNLFIRVTASNGLRGVGECSTIPFITGETQATCFEMAREFASIWKNRDAEDIEARMQDLHNFADFNATVKSAFDMALYDLAARMANQPLYRFLGGQKKIDLETDLTIGIDEPEKMRDTALSFIAKGVRTIKIKLGKKPAEDIERIKLIRKATGPGLLLRIDANQGWSFEEAVQALTGMASYEIQFCEQPMRHWEDYRLPELRKISPIPIMADESVFDHHDARRLIREKAVDYVNIKFAKSGGIHEARKINQVCEDAGIPCMMGGMLESRVALTAFAHFATAHPNIRFYDLDTCLLGHKTDPVTGGVRFLGFFLDIPDTPGLGADASDDFLKACEHIRV